MHAQYHARRLGLPEGYKRQTEEAGAEEQEAAGFRGRGRGGAGGDLEGVSILGLAGGKGE